MRAAAKVVLLALLVAVPAAAAWPQLRGGPERAGTLMLPLEPLDVVGERALVAPPEDMATLLGPALVETPHGLMGLARDASTGACRLLVVHDVLADEPRSVPLPACRWGWLQAYDAAHDQALVCSRGPASTPILQAYDLATGALRWGVAPTALGAAAAPDGAWGCSGTLVDVDAGLAVVPFHESRLSFDYPRHRIAAVRLATGDVEWWRAVQATSPVRADVSLPLADGGSANFLPVAATKTTTGYVVTGFQFNPAQFNPGRSRLNEEFKALQFAAAWLSSAGDVRGMAFSQLDPQQTSEGDPLASRGSDGGSFAAASSGSVALLALGNQILLVNPDDSRPVATAPLVTVDGLHRSLMGWAPPAWVGDRVVVPVSKSIASYSSDDLAREWVWGAEQGSAVVDDVVAGATGTLLVLTTTDLQRVGEPGVYGSRDLVGNSSLVTRLDGSTGRELQVVPVTSRLHYVPHADIANWTRPPSFVPYPQGVAVVDWTGRVVVLGRADPALLPRLAPSAPFPAPDEAVSLAVDAPGAVRLLVLWGDGTSEDVEPGAPLQHAYGALGRYEVTVTALQGDGRTGTSTVVVDVGGRPLTLMQQVFAPENQEVTFFVLGLGITACASAFGFMRLQRHHRFFRREADAIEETFARLRAKPPACEIELGERRSRVRSLLVSGKLTAAQATLLERRAQELASTLRAATIRDELAFLPVSLHRFLEELVVDGRVTQWERSHFLQALERDTILTPEQKERVREMVDDWFRRDAAAPA